MAEQLGTHLFFNLKTVNLIVARASNLENNYDYILVAYRTTKLYYQMARCCLDKQARTQTIRDRPFDFLCV